MSQGSQNVSFISRKRAKPIVNLNAAFRRRKDNGDSWESDAQELENKVGLVTKINNENIKKETVGSLHSDRPDFVPFEIESNSVEEHEHTLCTTLEPAKNDIEESIAESLSNRDKDTSTVASESVTLSAACVVSDLPTTESKVNSEPLPFTKCPPKSFTRFSRKNFAPIIRDRQLNGRHSRSSSLDKASHSTEVIVDAPHNSVAVEKENTVNSDVFGKDVDDLLDSGDESRNSISSTVSTLVLQNGSCVDSDSCIDDDQSSIVESLNDEQITKHPRNKRSLSTTSRRLLEARRDFESRFGSTKPDRNSLRMFDLIYYNPATNPMKSSQGKPSEAIISQPPVDLETERQSEENVDNPDNAEEEDEVHMPAPRVKVGPDGEIVLDEQSLVIETTQSKKSRKEMANLPIVVDTGSSTTYGTYSKKKRSRSDWNEKETLKFYRVLQTVGTDFSLMATVFKNRSRIDLKSKFKKEEKINPALIEKALRYPVSFDLTELEKEEEEEEEENISSDNVRKTFPKRKKGKTGLGLGLDETDCGFLHHKINKRIRKGRKEKPSENSKRKKRLSSACEDIQTEASEENLEKRNSRKKGEAKDYGILRNGIDAFVTSNNDDSVDDSPDAPPAIRRQPGSEDSAELLDVEGDNSTVLSDITQSEGNNCEDRREEMTASDEAFATRLPVTENVSMGNVQPGSLVLFTTECPDNPGYHICNVFMVQDCSNGSGVDSTSHTITLSFQSGEELPCNAGDTQPS